MKRRRFTLLNIISSVAFAIMALRLRRKLPLISLTINSHRGDRFSGFAKTARELIVNGVNGNLSRNRGVKIAKAADEVIFRQQCNIPAAI